MDSADQPPLYRQLMPGEIRLLYLLPGAKGSPIHCQLIYTFISLTTTQHSTSQATAPILRDFQALSYMWGPVGTEFVIKFDEREVPIRSNLWAGLQAIRDEEVATKLWVDAVCINQQDISERNAQVAIMGTIYATACRVLVWLGEAEDCSDMLLDNFSGLWFPRKTNPMEFDGRHELLHDAFEALCSRPYWRRVWIIQEVLIASDLLVLCGTRQVPWNSLFHKVVSDSYSLSPLGMGNSPPGYTIAEYRGGKGSKHTLPDLLHLCHICDSQSENTRDRIYGLLGVVLDDYGIIPDYSKSVPQLYVTTAQACLNRGIDNRSLVKSLQELLDNPLWDDESESFLGTSIFDETDRFQLDPSKASITTPMNTVARIELVGPIMDQSLLNTGLGFRWAATSSNRLKNIFSLERRVKPESFPLEFRLQHAIMFHRTQELGGVYRAVIGANTLAQLSLSSFESWESAKSLGKSTGTFRFFKGSDDQLGIAPCGVSIGDVICRGDYSQGPSLVVIRPQQKQIDLGEKSIGFDLVGKVLVHENWFPQSFTQSEMPVRFNWEIDLRTYLLLLR